MSNCLLIFFFYSVSDKDDKLIVAEVVDEVEEDIEEILASTNADPIDFIWLVILTWLLNINSITEHIHFKMKINLESLTFKIGTQKLDQVVSLF